MRRYALTNRGRDALQPSEEARGLRYYHGTSDTALGQRIVSEGVLRPGEDRDSPMAPMSGRTYLTKELGYALHYAIGANTSVLRHPEMMQRFIDREGRYGYIFVVDGQALEDVVPDEDKIGEYLCEQGRRSWIGRLFLDLAAQYHYEIDTIQRQIVYNEIEGFEKELELPDDEDERADYESSIEYYRDEYLFVDEAFGCSYPEVPAVGKFLLDHMDEEDLEELVEALDGGDAISAEGAVPVAECWRFDKIDDGAELVRRGTNAFFDIAERVC